MLGLRRENKTHRLSPQQTTRIIELWVRVSRDGGESLALSLSPIRIRANIFRWCGRHCRFGPVSCFLAFIVAYRSFETRITNYQRRIRVRKRVAASPVSQTAFSCLNEGAATSSRLCFTLPVELFSFLIFFSCWFVWFFFSFFDHMRTKHCQKRASSWNGVVRMQIAIDPSPLLLCLLCEWKLAIGSIANSIASIPIWRGAKTGSIAASAV